MQGSESEAVFDSLNLNPQLFINEVLNAVDDMVDGALEFYHQQASELLGDAAKDRSSELDQGVSTLYHMVQSVLDKRLGIWEKYSLLHCFSVPQGFSLPKADSSGNSVKLQDVLYDAELDSQLDSLREKLAVIGKESAELQGELCALEKQSLLDSSYYRSVTEALEPIQRSSTQDMFHEMMRTASELHKRVETVKRKRREEIENERIRRIYSPDQNGTVLRKKALPIKLEDLEEFVDFFKGK